MMPMYDRYCKAAASSIISGGSTPAMLEGRGDLVLTATVILSCELVKGQ